MTRRRNGHRARRSRGRRLALAVVVTTLASSSASLAYAAFAAVTGNAGNEFVAGSVVLRDDDAGEALFAMPSVRPGATATRCIRVTYDGTLPAKVRLYAGVNGALAPYVEVTVTRGSGSSGGGDCSGFEADSADYTGSGAGVLFHGTLAEYPASWSAGLVDPARDGGGAIWTREDAHDYRFHVKIRSDPEVWGQAAQATFHWEARNT